MISLIATVRNEKTTIAAWWYSLSLQTRQPDEWVIVDGGSTDGTWEWLREMSQVVPNLVIKQVPGNIASGRNAAIDAAKGDIIVVTDAGCTYAREWLAAIVRPIEIGEGEWSATAFGPDLGQANWLQTSLAALTTPAVSEFGRDWLPSSRSVAFQRSLWHTVQGYPTWLPFCEDVLFDQALAQVGKLVLVREPLVFWRPRPTILAYLRQVFNYTRSEAHASLNPLRQAARFAAYPVFVGLLAYGPVWLAPILYIAGLEYLQKYTRRWFTFAASRSLLLRFIGIIPLAGLLIAGDVAKMAGWLYGKYEILTGHVRKPV